jgi:3-keto-disaccharide hydrolase
MSVRNRTVRLSRKVARVLAASAVAFLAVAAIRAQAPAQPPAGGAPPAQGRGQQSGPRVQPLPFEDHTGFQQIFDGQSLKGWDGDPKFWRVENGAIVGESTPEKKVNPNTFMIWRGGEPKDFELKVEFKLNATNSGIQYRSVELKDVAQWVLKGYQADIDFDNQYTGQIYEERGRGFLALRGQAAYVTDGQPSRAVGTLESGDALKALIKQNDWNQVHIIARGSTLVQIINGHVMSVLVDDDTKNRALGGLLGFQMHMGNPMRVEFRNIWLKQL